MWGVPVNHVSTDKLGADCENFRVNSEYRTILQTALLWCGASTEELPDYERMCFSKGSYGMAKVIYGVQGSVKASDCLTKKTEAIARGINEGKLRVSINGDSDRHHENLWNKDWDKVRIKGEEFKAFLQEHYPNETPKNFFDEVEISTRKKITLEAYQSLQIEHQKEIKQLKDRITELEARLQEQGMNSNPLVKNEQVETASTGIYVNVHSPYFPDEARIGLEAWIELTNNGITEDKTHKSTPKKELAKIMKGKIGATASERLCTTFNWKPQGGCPKTE